MNKIIDLVVTTDGKVPCEFVKETVRDVVKKLPGVEWGTICSEEGQLLGDHGAELLYYVHCGLNETSTTLLDVSITKHQGGQYSSICMYNQNSLSALLGRMFTEMLHLDEEEPEPIPKEKSEGFYKNIRWELFRMIDRSDYTIESLEKALGEKPNWLKSKFLIDDSIRLSDLFRISELLGMRWEIPKLMDNGHG